MLLIKDSPHSKMYLHVHWKELHHKVREAFLNDLTKLLHFFVWSTALVKTKLLHFFVWSTALVKTKLLHFFVWSTALVKIIRATICSKCLQGLRGQYYPNMTLSVKKDIKYGRVLELS